MSPGPNTTGSVAREKPVPRTPRQTGAPATAPAHVFASRPAESGPIHLTPPKITAIPPEKLENIKTILSEKMPEVNPEVLNARILLGLIGISGSKPLKDSEIDEQFCLLIYQFGRAKELLKEEERGLAGHFFGKFNGTVVDLLEKTDDGEVADIIRGAVASKKALPAADLSQAVTIYAFRGKLIAALEDKPAVAWQLYNDSCILFAVSISNLILSQPHLEMLIKVADESRVQTQVAAYKEDFLVATKDLPAKEKVAAAVSLIQSGAIGSFSRELAIDILKQDPAEAVEQLAQKLSAVNGSIYSRLRFFVSGLPGLRRIGGEMRSIFDLILQIISDINDPEQLMQIITLLAEQDNGTAEKLLTHAIESLDRIIMPISSGYNTDHAILDLYYLLVSSRSFFESPAKTQIIRAAIKTIEVLLTIHSNPEEAREKIRALYTENPILYRIGLPYLVIGLNKAADNHAERELKRIMESSRGANRISTILSIIGSILPAETHNEGKNKAKSADDIPLFNELGMKKIMNQDYRLPYHAALQPVIQMFSAAIKQEEFKRVEAALLEVKQYLQRTKNAPYQLEDVLVALLTKSLEIMLILKGQARPE